ncbi:MULTISPECIES: 5'-nucleotidase C-terminal domain-containing protein [unclassified Endozoicomonas]|uniref:5'-nucleotidase C-terminal domain-containing protein n=1 Tax=unclassified Endozoicomonas TaxID=2644528 RepID=UPI003BB54E16
MPAKSPVINEFVFNHSGLDTNEFIEVLGDPLTDYSNLWLINVEGDVSSSNHGKVVQAFQLGTTNDSGFWTIQTSNQLQNGSQTLLLVDGFSGSVGQVFSESLYSAELDSVAVLDDVADSAFSNTVLAPEYDGISYTVGGASRATDGLDTDSANDFVRNDYSGDGILSGAPDAEDGEAVNTPNKPNQVVGDGQQNSPVPVKAIYEIQGAGHTSAFAGQVVATAGIVTALESNGFYLQGPEDGDIATSDALFVFTDSMPSVAVGDDISLAGTVSEYTRGGSSSGNLSITQLSNISELTVNSAGNDLPNTVVIGENGRQLPTDNVDDDALTSFDPETDGIDFFESLEGMRVTVKDAVAVSPTNKYGEIFTVADQGKNASGMNDRGGIALGQTDLNPERVQIQLDRDLLPDDFSARVNVADSLGDVTGVMSYAYGNYEVKATEIFTVTDGGLDKDMTQLKGEGNELTVASYNVKNLDANDDISRFKTLASQITQNLSSPDILALQEIQDNDGATDSGDPSADMTWQKLIDAITNAGGPVYEYVQVDPENNADGGQPGGNIRVGYLYNPDRVDYVAQSAHRLDAPAFAGTRKPLHAQFEFNGETVDLVNVHLSSKYGSTPIYGVEQPFVNAGYQERMDQAQAINDYVDTLMVNDPDANVMVLGDFNAFQWEGPADVIEGRGDDNVMTNLIDELDDGAVHTYNFQGNAQVLDQILVSNNLADSAEVDIVHINSEFADQASDHDPLLAKVTIGESANEVYTLQILHASDLEGGVEGIPRAANFAAIVDALEDTHSNSITLSAGDNFLTGPFFSAAEDRGVFRDNGVFNDFYNQLFQLTGDEMYEGLREGGGRVDISIMNAIGFDAAALGNHEFDMGTAILGDLMVPQYKGDGLGDDRWVGTLFPYLSANLDFSQDARLADLYTDDILPAQNFATGPVSSASQQSTPKIAPATILEEGGQKIGVVGATTPLLAQISSPGNTAVKGDAATDDMAALADILQPVIDQLMDQGVNKIILVSHLQQIALEKALVQHLSGVDVVIAGGSDTLQADETDVLNDGDVAAEDYPFTTTNKDGDPAVIVSTDGQYSYVGRLVIDFDADGKIILDDNGDATDVNESGAFATTDEQVKQLWGEEDAFAEGTRGDLVKDLTYAVQDIVNEKDSNILGKTAVYLEGRRESVRTEETNMGNLTADANLAAAQGYDSSVMVSIKNGGGIRAPIGAIEPDSEGGYSEQPPAANPLSGKQAGEISQLDVENALKFNNGLTLMTLTAEQLLAVLEHGVAASGPGTTPGQFAQVSGISFSFDASLASGERIRSAALVNENGELLQTLVENGELAVPSDMAIRIVTLNFLAGGGDGYPFQAGTDVVQLGDVLTDKGLADFAAPGSEQDALAEYLLAHYSDNPYQGAETNPADDTRIQNLAVRQDSVLQEQTTEPVDSIDDHGDGELVGGNGDDILNGAAGDDWLDGQAGNDHLIGGYGDDQLYGRDGHDRLQGDHGNDWLNGGKGADDLQGGAHNDFLFGGAGKDRLDGGFGNDELYGGKGHDYLKGDHGHDVLMGGNGKDQLLGGSHNDWLEGGNGADRLSGGSGHDYLAGGSGNDWLLGGSGGDQFAFENNSGHDVIRDFEAGSDTILLNGLGFDSLDAVRDASTQQGRNLLVDLGSNSSLTLIGVSLDQLNDHNVQWDDQLV